MRLRVAGCVQGVGFRYYTRARARALALCGVVRNLPDGSVEIAAEGPVDALESFVAQIRRGPRLSQVQECAVSWAPPTRRYTDFRIDL